MIFKTFFGLFLISCLACNERNSYDTTEFNENQTEDVGLVKEEFSALKEEEDRIQKEEEERRHKLLVDLITGKLTPKEECEYWAEFLNFCADQTCFCRNSDGAIGNTFNEYSLCLDTREFQSYNDIYDVPFVGKVGKRIKEIYVNGKKININDRNDLFFRQKIKLVSGYNRIPIKAVIDLGCSRDFYLVVNITETPDVIEIR